METQTVSQRYSRRTFLETSLAATTLTRVPTLSHILGARTGDFTTATAKPAFPVTDYHVHLSPELTIDKALALGKDRGVQLGILEHPGPNFAIKSDADLKQYIDTLRKHPVHIGLQPVYLGWSKAFSKDLLTQLDYILMDALTLPKRDGGYIELWQVTTQYDDEESFMHCYTQFIEQILTTEPIDIFGWPTFLPVAIARDYSQLWTRPRMEHIVELAAARKIAIEINEASHMPDEIFIQLAKQAGLKFSFGTDSRNQNAAHFSYCYRMAQQCGLTEADMFIPRKR
jgi:histidinol phosphatase-like PHP family hydrolase